MMSEHKHIRNCQIIAHIARGESTLGRFVLAMLCACLLAFWTPASAVSADLPAAASTAGMPPAVDPVAVLSEPFVKRGVFKTFDEFAKSLSTYGARVLAYGDDKLAWRAVTYTFPPFYSPTWKEVLDLVAWQTGSSWAFDPDRRQYKFSATGVKTPYTLQLPDTWVSSHREIFMAYMPKEMPVGMDVYYFGHFTTPSGRDPKRYMLGIRDYYAERVLKEYHVRPLPKLQSDMRRVTVAGSDALYWEPDQSNRAFKADGFWRQWAFVANDQAFVIVSTGNIDHKSLISSAVDRMLGSFTVSQN